MGRRAVCAGRWYRPHRGRKHPVGSMAMRLKPHIHRISHLLPYALPYTTQWDSTAWQYVTRKRTCLAAVSISIPLLRYSRGLGVPRPPYVTMRTLDWTRLTLRVDRASCISMFTIMTTQGPARVCIFAFAASVALSIE